jgi:hypothetical protein
LLNEGPHTCLAGLGAQCGQLNPALYQNDITYAIESALPG